MTDTGNFSSPLHRPAVIFRQRSIFSPFSPRSRRQLIFTTDHKVPLEFLVAKLETDVENGLSKREAAKRLARDGLNVLTPPLRSSEWITFAKKLFGGFSSLLWIGAVICFVSYVVNVNTSMNALPDDLYLGGALVAVVVITSCFQYYQEAKSSNIVRSFSALLPHTATVIRDGVKCTICSENIVVGDVIEMKSGDRVPADVRIIQQQRFKVDNSSLTGESKPQSRSVECTDDNPQHTKNLAFFSTNAIEGWARGVVICTGDRTIMGDIAQLAFKVDSKASPIAREIHTFLQIITSIAFFFGLLSFAASMAMGYRFLEAAIFLIGVIVGHVPEGLPATITVCLALTAKRLANKNCLVKNLEAVETLGSATVICTDKTGTLTQNRMTVAHLWLNGQIVRYDCADDFVSRRLETGLIDNESFRALTRIAALCNNATFKAGQDTVPLIKRETIGDASESALLKFAEMTTGDVEDFRTRNRKVCEILFNSTDKYQVSIHANEDYANKNGTPYRLVIKGAPERIFDKCKTILVDGIERDINANDHALFERAYETLAAYGERVFGLADLMLPADQFPEDFIFDADDINFPLTGLRFVGLISMIDPPRPGVSDAVAQCRSAGIRVIMVTGDHPTTAAAIAKTVGIISGGLCTISDVDNTRTVKFARANSYEPSCVIHGERLQKMSDDELDFVLSRYAELAFARTSPQQKLKIVEACQRRNEIVAVTGDGVNDSPALRKADIGIAMGITGSDASKEAADMILLDDNFSTIVTGIREGRLLFDNLKKSIAYTLTSKIPELSPLFVFILFQIPLPLGAVSILCIDLGTDIWPAIALAYEEPEGDLMKRKPRHHCNDNLISDKLFFYTYGIIGIMQAAAGFFVYLCLMTAHGFWPLMLWGIRAQWDSAACNNLQDSYGQEWTYANRKVLEYTCNTAYFCSIVLVQYADLLTTKTRFLSLVQQGMRNWSLNWSLIFETLLCTFLAYCPGLDHGLRMYGLRFLWWFLPLPFAVLIFCFDEFRRLLIRRNPEGLTGRITYY